MVGWHPRQLYRPELHRLPAGGKGRGTGDACPRLYALRGLAGGDTLWVSPWTSSSKTSRMPGSGLCRGRRPRYWTMKYAPIICPDKINTQQWADVMRAAHAVGLRATTTVMFGHVDGTDELGASPNGAARRSGRDRRLHRVRAAARSSTWAPRSFCRAVVAGDRPSRRRSRCTPSVVSPCTAT